MLLHDVTAETPKRTDGATRRRFGPRVNGRRSAAGFGGVAVCSPLGPRAAESYTTPRMDRQRAAPWRHRWLLEGRRRYRYWRSRNRSSSCQSIADNFIAGRIRSVWVLILVDLLRIRSGVVVGVENVPVAMQFERKRMDQKLLHSR